jgi:hypothetical protein
MPFTYTSQILFASLSLAYPTTYGLYLKIGLRFFWEKEWPERISGSSEFIIACCAGLQQAILFEEDEGRRVVLRGQAIRNEPGNYLKP